MDNIKKWTTEIKYKKSTAILLSAIMLIVLLNNINERKNLVGIHSAANAIYEDRLLPESYIFSYYEKTEKMHDIMGDKMMDGEQKQHRLKNIISQIKGLNVDYLKTELTDDESHEFSLLQKHIDEMENYNERQNLLVLNLKIDMVRNHLHRLSEIQLQEAQNQIKTINQLNGNSMVSLRFEIYMILIFGLIIQALIFASKTLERINLNKDASVWN